MMMYNFSPRFGFQDLGFQDLGLQDLGLQDLGFYPAFPQPFQTANTPRYGTTRSVGSSTVHFTPGTSWPEPGCVVASVATIAKVPYEKARQVAANVANFDGSHGLTYDKAQDMLSAFGISSTRYTQGSNWSDLPNLAIVSVHGESGLHAVVFKRKNGQEFVYDYGVVRSPSQYQLADGDEYLEIHR